MALSNGLFWHVGGTHHSFDLWRIKKVLGQELRLTGNKPPLLCKRGFHGSRRLIDALFFNTYPTIEIRELYDVAEEDENKAVGAGMKIVGLIEDASEILHDFCVDLLYKSWELVKEEVPLEHQEYVEYCMKFIKNGIQVLDPDIYAQRLDYISEQIGVYDYNWKDSNEFAVTKAEAFIGYLAALMHRQHITNYLQPYKMVKVYANTVADNRLEQIEEMNKQNIILEKEVLKHMEFCKGEPFNAS